MAENEPSPEAEDLARVQWGETFGDTERRVAQRAIDAGWTPPPDPHVDIARELWESMYAAGWRDENCSADDAAQTDLLDAVRRMDLRRATDG